MFFHQQPKQPPYSLTRAIMAGTAAGLLSGMVKIGWEAVLPPRTPQRDAENPPATLMRQIGIPEGIRHATYRYSEQEIPWAGFIIHFGFSTTFAIIYEVLAQKFPKLKADHGTRYGLAVWALFHLFVMPAMGTVPSAKDQPVDEHLSEALGHMVWMWANDFIGDDVYQALARSANRSH